MLLYPLEAFARSLHLGEVVVPAALCADYACDHRRYVHILFFRYSTDPSRRTGIYVGLPRLRTTCAYPDECGVASAAVDLRSRSQSQLRSCFISEVACHICTFYDTRQMLRIHAVHPAQRSAPALVPLSWIIQERGVRRVPGHDELSCAPAYQILLDVQPFIYPAEYLRFIFLHPLVFPQWILDACRCRVCHRQAPQQHPGIDA